MSNLEDEITVQAETAQEFEKSSLLFFEADKFRYVDHDDAEAEKKYREAMDATGDYGVFYHLAQGQIYSMRGNIEYALTEFEIASEISDQIEAVFINLGLTYRKIAGRLRSFNFTEKAAEMTEESIAALHRALEINPSSSGAWSSLAITYINMGRDHYSQAELCISRAKEIDPQSYQALSTLANLRRLQGKKEEARQLALDAVSMRPDDAFIYGVLGARKDRGTEPLESKAQHSIAWLEKGLAREPNNTYLLSEIGKAYREGQKNTEAAEYFDRAVKAEEGGDKKYGLLANRGEAYIRIGELGLAEADLRQALVIRPDYSFALTALMKLCKELGKHEEGYHLAELVLERNNTPQNIRQFQELKNLFQQDRDESIAITRKLISSGADTRSKATRERAERALRLFSKNHDAWGLLGRCCAERGEFEAARIHLDRALTLRPDAYSYRLSLGLVLEQLGEWKAAEREFRAFVARASQKDRGQEGLRRVREHLQREERHKALSATGGEIVFLNTQTGREERHSIRLIRDFLYDRMNDWQLPIREIIEEIGDEPVFIIAKTGVGKTVTVPTKVLLGLCDNLLRGGADLTRRFPQIYVVEPRIPICTMTMAEMNDGYQSYVAYRMIDFPEFRSFLASKGVKNIEQKDHKTISKIVDLAYQFVATGNAPYDPRHFNLYGCITSATGKINADAPILFITTGIMESLTFEGNKLDPKYHRIIIDEAHVTIEANPAIELGIALARKRGIKIDYMSATVDPATLAADLGVKIVYAGTQRFPIHLTNLNATVEESILDLVEHFLLEPDESRFPRPKDFADPTARARAERVRLHLLSRDDFQDEGKTYRGLKNRPQGMLVIVNSHQSENSDTHRIADLIARADFNRGATRVHTLRLASPVVRDPAQKLAFDRLIKSIEDENGRYVIVATNVVEMGLTFSSLDYVVTMDSEFETTFVDGGQMISKVGLGVNALYQRIGRAGRVRPGMAFIARDFGAAYCELDDETLAAGLREAPIRYPMAKGSFLKLALYSFRERMPEHDLRQKIADLNLPSRIQDDAGLWSRFLVERKRLRRIGVAAEDELTPAGEDALKFIGLDDMDFANLLATVIHKYGVNSDLAIIFTVLAASSELGFTDLMANRFFLTNPKQLSAEEIFHEDILGIPVTEASELIRHYEQKVEQLYDALRSKGVDDQICSDICAFVRAGYKLVSGNRVDDEDLFTHASSTAAIGDTDESDTLAIEDELPEQVKCDLDQFSTTHTLAFERAVVSFSEQSELINIYRIYRHFFNNYFSRLKPGTLSSLELSELRRVMEEEAEKLQVSIRGLTELNNSFSQLSRHVGIKLSKEETQLPLEYRLSEDDRLILRESYIRDLLFEREGDDERFDLCLRFYKLVDDREKLSSRDFSWVGEQLEQFGFEVTNEQVKELWFLIVREARKRCDEQFKQFSYSEGREVLPPISKGIEGELLRTIREVGYHRKLVFSRGNFGFTTEVTDQSGTKIEVSFSDENNPIGPALSGREKLTVFAKLTPAILSKAVRDDGSASGFTKREEKGFRLSHITWLG